MALFFYELIRDQIVFIWHAGAVVHGSPLLSAGPCLQYPWWPWRKGGGGGQGKNKAPLVSKWCQGQILNTYLFILSLYLFNCTVSVKIRALRLLPISLTCYFLLSLKQKLNKNRFGTFRDWCYTSTLQKLQSYRSLMNFCTHSPQTLACFDFPTSFWS